MPNRILRDWTDSEAVNQLSWQAEVFFVRLIMKVDDYGRYPAGPKFLRSLLFPIRDDLRDADMTRLLAECEKAGLIAVYTQTGKSFLEIVNFGQRARSRSKYPPPPIDGHLRANVRDPPSSARKCPPYAHAHSEAHSEAQAHAEDHHDPPIGGKPARMTPGDDDTDQRIRRHIGGMTSVLWSPRVHAKFRKIVDLYGWDAAVAAVDKAVAEGASEPFSYAGAILDRGRAKNQAKSAEGDDQRRRVMEGLKL